MTADSPDFQVTIKVNAVPTADGPDWQLTATGPGGASVGGYASLTGPGQTATPGDLTQEGGFVVNSGGAGIVLDNNGPPGFGFLNLVSNSGIALTESTTTGVNIQTNAAGYLGFYGATPIQRPPVPVTLGDVIQVLTDLGLV